MGLVYKLSLGLGKKNLRRMVIRGSTVWARISKAHTSGNRVHICVRYQYVELTNGFVVFSHVARSISTVGIARKRRSFAREAKHERYESGTLPTMYTYLLISFISIDYIVD